MKTDNFEIAVKRNSEELLQMYRRTFDLGFESTPRGLRILELLDAQISISPYAPFNMLQGRNYNLNYFKEEMTWKLGANKFDDSIKQHAKMWESVQNPDGTYNSNYGVYWFGAQNGLMNALGALLRDKDSRQAVIPMLAAEHMTPQTVDTVCTECVGFFIRNDKLHMSVHMRSSDQIFGLGTDLPTFAFLYRLAFGILSDQYLIETGDITVTAMSSHIYQRHFDMANTMMLAGDTDSSLDLSKYNMPWCNAKDATFLIHSRGKNLERGGPLGQWLLGKS